jgi:hypothetical protein
MPARKGEPWFAFVVFERGTPTKTAPPSEDPDV